MGRGTADDAAGSSLLYGAAISRRTGASDPLRIEHELRRLSAPLEDISATDGIKEVRGELRDFLEGHEVPAGNVRLDGIDNYAVKLEWTIEQADYTHFSEYEPGGALDQFVAEADLLVARAGHRIDGSCLEALIRRRLAMDFFVGPGREYLEERLGLLMDQPGIRRREGGVILRAVVPGGSHFEDPDTRLPLCGESADAELGAFRRFVDPVPSPSCPACRKASAHRRTLGGELPRVTEDVGLQLERLSVYLTPGAALEMVSTLRRDARSLDPEEYLELRRKALWGALCARVADEARKQKLKQPPFNLLSAEGKQLRGLWDPERSDVPSLPEGLRI